MTDTTPKACRNEGHFLSFPTVKTWDKNLSNYRYWRPSAGDYVCLRCGTMVMVD